MTQLSTSPCRSVVSDRPCIVGNVMGLTQVEKEDNFLFQNRGMWNTTYFFIFH